LESLSWFENNLAFSFFVGFFFGIIIIDTVYSTNLIVKVRKFARENGLIVKYEEFKSSILEQAMKNKEKYSFVFAITNNVKSIEGHINRYMKEQIEKTHKIKATINLMLRDKVKFEKVKLNKKGENDESSNPKS
jgi:hypothetical protein